MSRKAVGWQKRALPAENLFPRSAIGGDRQELRWSFFAARLPPVTCVYSSSENKTARDPESGGSCRFYEGSSL